MRKQTKMKDFMLPQTLKLKTLQFLNPHLLGPLKFKSLPTRDSPLALLSTQQSQKYLESFCSRYCIKKNEDASVPSAGQAGTQPAEGEKNTNQTAISQLFQRKAAKNANLTKQQSKPTPPPTRPIIPPVITTTTTQMQYPFLQSIQKGSSQPEGERIKKDKGKKDPLNKLNDLSNKKRKHVDDIHDNFKANKRLKTDFVTIEDLKDFPNTMLYTLQEIFFKRHQGPGLVIMPEYLSAFCC
ncbi:hypothetical protein Tco_0516605 [Tanacetum coccineum]